jgi:nucleoid-associated protein YgaU
VNDGLPRQAPLRPGAVDVPAAATPARRPTRTSRHAGLDTYRREVAGRDVVLFAPRLPPAAPAPAAVAVERTYEVAPGDRLDLVAARLLGDPHQYWRIADANPGDLDGLEEPGRTLRLPEPL